MKNKKMLFSLAAVSLLLTSCSKGFIRYGVQPYIEIEKQEKGELKNLYPSSINEKINNKESFVLLIHNYSCQACKYAKETYIYPFLESHPIIIYGMDSTEFSIYQDEKELYNQIVKPFGNIDSKGDRFVPYLSIFDNGEFINGEKDIEFYTVLLEAYIIF